MEKIMKTKEIQKIIEFHRKSSCPAPLQIASVELLDKYNALSKKFNKMKEALTYCANHARPSVIADVAKEALLSRKG
jgi:hypothetical protein